MGATTIAYGASSLVDPDQPAVGRLVWWLFFTSALMAGMGRAESWATRWRCRQILIGRRRRRAVPPE
ncbi:hypothetical protein [Kitasatospora sp. NPDC093806]|uniref:hypothetical protein n=1 Tax=Kitasatospora sp. NPDC093806 TaxID=3155075 RepID=UPI003448B12D